MDNNTLTIKWKMKNSRWFVGEKGGYAVHVNITKGAAPTWFILKDGMTIDECYCHPPTKCELSAKIQAEKTLNAIL